MSEPLNIFYIRFRFNSSVSEVRIAAPNLSEAIRLGITRIREEVGEPDQILSAKSL